MPLILKKELVKAGSQIKKGHPLFYFSMKTKKNLIYKIFGMTLDNFLEIVKPCHIKKVHDISLQDLKFATSLSTKKNKSNRNDQVFKCMSCDEDEVRWWEEKGIWLCDSCGVKNDYPE